MTLRTLLIGTLVVLAGCQAIPVTVTQTPEELPPPVVDPELAELMALLGRGGSTEGPPVPESPAVSSMRQCSFGSVGSDVDPSVDRSGRAMAYASTAHSLRPDIFIKGVHAVTATQLTTDPGSDMQPAISPDSKSVAFVSDRSGAWEIYIMSVDGKAIRQVTRGGGHHLKPAWSPDGRRLAYCRRNVRSGQWELWAVSLAPRLGRQFLGYGLMPAWSPVGEQIAYQRPRGRDGRLYEVWTIRFVNGEPGLPTLVAGSAERGYLCPTFSGDGKRLAFTGISTEGGLAVADIYTVGVDGENMQRLTRGPGRKFSPTWVGRTIYFSCNRDGHENIWSVQANDGKPLPAVGERTTTRAETTSGS